MTPVILLRYCMWIGTSILGAKFLASIRPELADIMTPTFFLVGACLSEIISWKNECSNQEENNDES